jgi:hypothetical protein
MHEILGLKEWNKAGTKLSVTYYSSSTKWLDKKAAKLHSEVDEINKFIMKGKYVIKTFLYGTRTKDDYKLNVKVKYYEDESKYEHKANSHRQKIYL